MDLLRGSESFSLIFLEDNSLGYKLDVKFFVIFLSPLYVDIFYVVELIYDLTSKLETTPPPLLVILRYESNYRFVDDYLMFAVLTRFLLLDFDLGFFLVKGISNCISI